MSFISVREQPLGNPALPPFGHCGARWWRWQSPSQPNEGFREIDWTASLARASGFQVYFYFRSG